MQSRRGWRGVVGILTLAAAPMTTAIAAKEKEPTAVDASKGGFTLESGDNSVTFGARVQVRATFDDRENFDADAVGTTGFGVEDGVAKSFDIPRLRLTFKGGMFKPWLKYELQFEMSRTSGQGSSKIKDAVVEIHKNPLAVLKLGQYKAPFSLQQLTSSGRLQFVDRAITDTKFAPGRDTGVTVTGTTEKKAYGYAAGVFNGSGESNQQDDEALLWVGRVWFDPFGEYKLSESSNDATDKPVFHAGLGYRTGEAMKGTATAGVVEDPDNESAWNLELAFKQRRFFATGEYFAMTDERVNTLTPGEDVESTGYNAQVGFMVVPEHLEVGLRYASIDPDDDVDNAKVSEARAVVGYCWKGHNLKLQGDVGQIEFQQGFGGLSALATRNMPSLGTRIGAPQDYKDKQVRLQLQLAF